MNVQETLSPANAEAILSRLPERIRKALVNRAVDIGYPIETVEEMVIASYLDSDTLSFTDCKPG